MKNLIGLLIIIASWLLGGYLGIWTFFVQPIMRACLMFDAGTLTASVIGFTVLKCFFASTIASLVIYFGTIIGASIID